MEHNSNMMQFFRRMIGMAKSDIHSLLGEPQIRFPSHWAYHQNGLWMVLGFKDDNLDGESIPALASLTVYDEQLALQWSRGIQLMPADWTPHSTLDAFFDAYGVPHGSLLSGGNLFYYLTENGCIVYISPEADESLEVNHTTLTDLDMKISSARERDL